ncbi:FKBP12-associated protein 1-like protein [Favolaschia claudopus]|uniref:FKBP12-associated protein 1-like protein n=1 Tax=Favolaschia claudopus TaxID=2862362 RepID=A0AAW0B0A5_9AGAR
MEGPDNPARPPPAERPAPEGGNNRGRNNNRRNNQRAQQDANASNAPNGQSRPRSDHRGRRPPRGGGRPQNANDTAPDLNQETSGARTNQNWRSHEPNVPETSHSRRGRAKFNPGLTSGDQATSSNSRSGRPPKPKPAPVADDLTSRLTAALNTPPYPDCPICFSAVHPAQPTWSCSPSIPVLETQQYCWTTFHLKCVRSWATKSVKEVADAWAARGEPHRGGEWRCPGCQARRIATPTNYRCFCDSIPSPAPPRISTAHSCASPCTRSRPACSHPCPLLCHPGPCPPCRITTDVKCGCSKGTVLALRCGETNISCGAVCGRQLSCGKHSCERECHTDECTPCTVRETAQCYCGKEEREIGCGEGEAETCEHDQVEVAWIGRFKCNGVCDRLFACGVHHCPQPCHAANGPAAVCPRSPEKVRTCPCGRRPIALSSKGEDEGAFPPRFNCSAPIPTCGARCGSILPCGHACAAPCHEGVCPPCLERVVRPCRCGGTNKTLFCSEANAHPDNNAVAEILCEKTCKALRACGRHQCLRVCCPLASVAAMQSKSKGKKRANAHGDAEVGIGEERGGLHECDLVCGKPLSCGEHRCELRDHKGPCGPCLRSSFEELICPCGRTILEPPIPCGTRMQCTYQCPRPPPLCGHPRTQHMCHSDEAACPPCPFLTTKKCMCGKKDVGNVRCAQERVSCGSVCGRLLGCGYHHCERLCHSAEEGCGACVLTCGKPRKLCLPSNHPCTHPCHAPSSCDETTPCTAVITVNCACGRIRQPLQCGKSISTPTGRENQQPKCTNECLIAKRNARLADALGITPESRERGAAVTWPDEVLAFGRANPKFVGVVEKAFADFVASDKKMQVLPHMPVERRKFVHDVAAIYRMDSQMVDQEPHRSVQLLRRFDTKVPTPPLSAALASSPPPPSLGKLADLRAGMSPSWRAPSSSSKPSPAPTPPPSAPRAWGAASAPTPPASAIAQPRPAPTPPPIRAPAAAVAVPVVPPTSTEVPEDVPEDWEDDT